MGSYLQHYLTQQEKILKLLDTRVVNKKPEFVNSVNELRRAYTDLIYRDRV